MATPLARPRCLAVGLSRFSDPALRPLPFAAADARAFSDALDPAIERTLLTDLDATRDAVAHALSRLASAAPDDLLWFFAISHTSAADGRIHFHCHDGTLPLVETLRPLWDAPARRILLFLDLHRAGPGDPSPLSLASELALRPGRAILLADDGAHGSHVSGELQAGIWARHVTSAFAGNTLADAPDGTLTVASLRDWLSDEIARSVARAFTDGRRQSPTILAATDEETLLERLPASCDEPSDPFAGLRFFTQRELPVKALAGFRKSLHSPPADTLASSRDWVARLAEPDLARELEETVARLRRHLGYKRRDLRSDGPAAGAASILTPDFAWHVTVRQHPQRPAQALISRTLDSLRNADILQRPQLADAFPQGFHSLHHPFEAPADLAEWIDRLEDAAPPALRRLDYPTDLAFCDLELDAFDGRVRLERDGVTIHAPGPASPAELALQFAAVRRLLHGIR